MATNQLSLTKEDATKTVKSLDAVDLEEAVLLDEIDTLANPDSNHTVNNSVSWQAIELQFKEATFYLKVAIDQQIARNQTAFKENLQLYRRNWQQIALIIEKETQQTALFNVVHLFNHKIKYALESEYELTAKQVGQLNKWQNLFAEFSHQQNNPQLLESLTDCVNDSAWEETGFTNDKDLLVSFNQALVELETTEPALSDILTMDTEIGEDAASFSLANEPTVNLYHPIWDKISPYYDKSQIACDTFETEKTDNSLEALQAYIDCWSSIGEAIADEGLCELLSLIDLCLLLADNCQQLADNPSYLTPEYGQLLKEWQLLFKIYLHDVEIEQNLLLLVKVLENNLWLSPLTTEDRKMFLDLNSTDALEENSTFETMPIQPEKTVEITPIKTAVETKKINPEFIKMLSDEFVLLVRNLSPAIMDLSDAYAFQSVLKVHYLKFEHLAKACETIGLEGLATVFKFVLANIVDGCENKADFSKNERTLFNECLLLIQMYIMDVSNDAGASTLVNHLQTSDWAFPLDNLQVQSLTQLLSAVEISSEDENKSLGSRKTIADPTDICLKLPKDVNQELLNSLLNELPVLTANFSAVLQKIISINPHPDYVLEAQRIAHTLKGSGNMVGITGIAVLTHHLEEILAYLTEKQRFPTKALAASLLEAADCLEMMSEVILIGKTEEPDNALQVLQSILDWSNKIFKEGLPEENSPLEAETNLPAITKGEETVAVQTPKTTESVEMTRVSSQLIDKLLRITGEASILREQFKERINHFSEELKTLNQLTGSMQTLVLELDQSVTLQSYSTANKTADSEFDSLEMEQYNELHTTASRIAEVATDIRNLNITMDEKLIDLKYLIRDEEVVQKENQQIVQSIRMVPVNTISSRCQRIVRQACRMTDKEIELTIQGNEVLIDSKILNRMIEPLMHLLRNAVDHGIEPKTIRQKNNKTEVGKINLEFTRKGNYVVMRCQDDGCGLSSERILQTAIQKKLITAEQSLTKAEIYKLILMPGFSTRTNVTQVSGRGIGMDVVQTKIASLQGQMSISSVEGEGLSIEILIPQTLASMLSLLVRCNGRTMAISNRGLEKIYHSDDYELLENNRCQIATKQYATRYFAELLGIPITYDKTKKLPALRISDEIGKTYLVFVDELLEYRNLLVKDMGDYISHIQGVTGASILGNGEVAPVIDLVEMLHHTAKYDFLSIDATKGMINKAGERPMALVVDDSLSARRAVVMLLEDYGLEVKTAIDGLEAIKQIEDKQPDIMLVDLEMPRMNGIELSAHLKGCNETKKIPIIMITSRATEKHRRQAKVAGVTKFMIKPFSEEALINNVNELITTA